MLTLVPSVDDLPITEADLEAWLATAQPGDRFVYHRGFLAVDASGSTGRLPLPRVQELRRVARLAFAAVQQGTVHALQERNGPNDFTYLLIARAPRRRSPAAKSDRRPDPTPSPAPPVLPPPPSCPSSAEASIRMAVQPTPSITSDPDPSNLNTPLETAC